MVAFVRNFVTRELVMALVQRDWILRMIEAVAAAIARVLRRRQAGDLAGARQEVDVAISELLGPLAALVMRADSRTAADLIGDGRRIAAWARLVALDAETLRLMGQSSEAASAEQRALELLIESSLRDRVLDDDARATLDRLRPAVSLSTLAPRYRDALAQFHAPPRP